MKEITNFIGECLILFFIETLIIMIVPIPDNEVSYAILATLVICLGNKLLWRNK